MTNPPEAKMEPLPLSHWMQKSAQLWCKPKHSKKEMDADLAFSIAELALDAYNEGRKSRPAISEVVEAFKNALARLGALSRRLGVVHHEGNWQESLERAETAVIDIYSDMEKALASTPAVSAEERLFRLVQSMVASMERETYSPRDGDEAFEQSWYETAKDILTAPTPANQEGK